MYNDYTKKNAFSIISQSKNNIYTETNSYTGIHDIVTTQNTTEFNYEELVDLKREQTFR